MGCSLTSRPAPLSCGAFPFLHPRRQRDGLPAPSFTRDIPDPDRVGHPPRPSKPWCVRVTSPYQVNPGAQGCGVGVQDPPQA